VIAHQRGYKANVPLDAIEDGKAAFVVLRGPRRATHAPTTAGPYGLRAPESISGRAQVATRDRLLGRDKPGVWERPDTNNNADYGRKGGTASELQGQEKGIKPRATSGAE